MPAASPLAVTPGAPPQLPNPAAAAPQAPPSATVASLPPPPQQQALQCRASGGGGSSPTGAAPAVPNNRAALALIPSNSMPLPPHSCAPNSSSAHGTVVPATPSFRSSVGSAGSQPSVTAMGLPLRGAGGLVAHSRLPAGSAAAVQPDDTLSPAEAGTLAHGIGGGSQAAAEAAGLALAAAAAAAAQPTLQHMDNSTAMATLLPHTQAHRPEELHRSAAVQPPAPFLPAACPVLGGAAAPGAAATMLGEDSPLEAASELFAALASASEFACLADAEVSQQ